MTEVIKAVTPHHFEPRLIPAEAFGKFSTGEVDAGNGIAVTGEGQNRRLIFTLKPEDPGYNTYRTELDSTISTEIELTEQIKICLEEMRKSELGYVQRGILWTRKQLSKKGFDPYEGPKADELVSVQRKYEEKVIQIHENTMRMADDVMLDYITSKKNRLLSEIPVMKIQRLLDQESVVLGEIENTMHGDNWDDEARKKRREELYLQLNQLRGLREHVTYLYEQGAFEIVLPNEERIQLAQKKT